jgi:hypothetical protein
MEAGEKFSMSRETELYSAENEAEVRLLEGWIEAVRLTGGS